MENKGNRLVLTTLTSLLSLTLFAATANVLPAVASQLGNEYQMNEAIFVKWTFPVQFAGFILLSFLGGVASDIIGKRLTMMLGCGAVGLGCLLWICAPGLTVLYIGAAILGMGGGILETVGCACLTDLHPTRSKLFMNLSQVFYCAGAISIGALCGYLVERGAQWRHFYIALCVASMLLMALFSLTRFPRKATEGGSRQGGASGGALVRKLLPAVWLPAVATFLYVYAETACYAFGPKYLKILGAGDSVSTLSIAVFWGAVCVARIGCSFLPQNQTYEPVICGSFLLAGLASIAQVFASDVGAGLVLLGASGLFCGGTWPMIVSMVNSRHSECSGTASGIVISVGAFGCIVCPLTLGSIFDQGHASLAFLLLGASFILGMICIFISRIQNRARQGKHQA